MTGPDFKVRVLSLNCTLVPINMLQMRSLLVVLAVFALLSAVLATDKLRGVKQSGTHTKSLLLSSKAESVD